MPIFPAHWKKKPSFVDKLVLKQQGVLDLTEAFSLSEEPIPSKIEHLLTFLSENTEDTRTLILSRNTLSTNQLVHIIRRLPDSVGSLELIDIPWDNNESASLALARSLTEQAQLRHLSLHGAHLSKKVLDILLDASINTFPCQLNIGLAGIEEADEARIDQRNDAVIAYQNQHKAPPAITSPSLFLSLIQQAIHRIEPEELLSKPHHSLFSSIKPIEKYSALSQQTVLAPMPTSIAP